MDVLATTMIFESRSVAVLVLDGLGSMIVDVGSGTDVCVVISTVNWGSINFAPGSMSTTAGTSSVGWLPSLAGHAMMGRLAVIWSRIK